MLRVILTTGGTGGHIFPALAVADALREMEAELLFVGGTYGPEAALALRAGIPFHGLPGRGFLGRGLRAIPAAGSMFLALGEALRVVRNFNPCAVAAFGGYASFATAMAAVALRIPLLVHEQNAVAGASNRFLSRFAGRICASVDNTQGFRRPFVVTGNPVRSVILKRGRIFSGKNLLILGGSQGAHALNEFIIGILPDLNRAGVNLRHQTGQKDYEAVRAAYKAAGYAGECVSSFIDDMAEAYAWADLALCRAGASTIAEICICGLPAVLVPFPAAIHDHQTLNAKALEKAGAAILLPESELGAKGLQVLERLFSDPERLAAMSSAATEMAMPDAAQRVAGEIEKLCASGKK